MIYARDFAFTGTFKFFNLYFEEYFLISRKPQAPLIATRVNT
jgi:hypothetical protein